MKHLILVRHAKSSWRDASLSDRDRPLNARGERDAPRMAARLAAREPRLQALFTSPAARARATAEAFAETLGVDVVREVPELYLASAERWLELVRGLDDGLERVAMFGHNPGVTLLVELLAGPLERDLPTCAVARLELDVARWSAVAPGRARLVELDFPKRAPEPEAPA